MSFRKMLLQIWFITHSSQSEELFLHVAGTVAVLAPEQFVDLSCVACAQPLLNTVC